MSNAPASIRSDSLVRLAARLARLRLLVALWFWVDGVGRVLWLALALAAADLALDWLVRFDRPQRAVLLVGAAAALASALYRRLVRPLATRLSDDALALRVEAAHRELGQRLISALQLARLGDAAGRGVSPVLVEHAVRSGAQAAERIRFSRILDRRRFRTSAGLLALALAALGGVAYGVLATEPLAIWLDRNLLLGERTWPQETYLVVERAAGGVVVLPRGEDWTQIVSVTQGSRVVPAAVYLDLRRSASRGPLAMRRASERQFQTTFRRVVEPFEFRARGGDAVTGWVRVELVEPPALAELKLVVTPPAYTGRPAAELAAGQGPYHVLKGSSLSISATANKPLASADLSVDGKRLPLRLDDLRHVSGEVPAAILIPGQYAIELEDTLGLVDRQPATFALRTRVDHPPTVRVRLHGVGGLVVPQARIRYVCGITDDFGLTAGSIVCRFDEQVASLPLDVGQAPRLPSTAGEASSLPELAIDATLDLAPLNIPAGANLRLQFEAADNDTISGPNVGKSPDFFFRVVTEDELRADVLRREKEQRFQFERLLKDQEDLLTDTRILASEGHTELASGRREPPETSPNSARAGELIQMHRRQQRLAHTVAAVAERFEAIALEIQTNRLEEPGGPYQTRLRTQIVEPIRALAAGTLLSAAAALADARRLEGQDRTAVLSDAIGRQTEAAAQMKAILDHMVQSANYQEAINLLYEIQRAQTEVHEQTDRARQERLKRLLDGPALGPPSGRQP